MKINVALADDHQLVRKGIRLLIENLGEFTVCCEASNGKELIENIHSLENHPDLVLVDVNMPVMNGVEAVKKLREEYPELRIIALSVNDQLTVIRDMIRSGANAYLFKDSSPETFYKVLIEVYKKGFYYDKAIIDSLLLTDDRPTTSYQKMLETLSERERLFLQYCCTELTYKEIAALMGVSHRTVDGYRTNVFEKLQIKSRIGLVLFAFHSGLVTLENL